MGKFYLLTFFLFTFSFNYSNGSSSTLKDSLEEVSDTVNLKNTKTTINLTDTIRSDIEPYTSTMKPDYFITKKEFWLAIAVLICLIIVLIFEFKLIKERQLDDQTAVRLLIVTMVILGSLFIIIAGYTDTQIAPIFALFGTICGYLFGKMERNNNTNT